MTRPDVVIVTHESANEIVQAIGTLPQVTSVLVVDNASRDDSATLAAASGALVVTNVVNEGFAAAANQGARLGHADSILFLNPDAVISTETLDRLVKELEADPGVAVVSPQLRGLDGRAQRVEWPFPSVWGAWREAVGLHRVWPPSDHSTFVIGACFLVRRSVFEELGGFDTRYWLYGEETDLCRRAIDAGWRVAIAPDEWATHVGGVSRGTAPRLAAEHFERGGERFVADRGGAAGLIAYRVANVFGAVIRSVLPGDRARRDVHRARLARTLRVLATTPMAVPLDSPATAAPGSLVVCSLEAWDEVWRRNQFLIRELLATDPHRRVLLVEPAFDWMHELRHTPRTRRRRRGLRPVTPDGRVLALEPGKVVPRMLGGFADRSLCRQITRACARAGLAAPTLWINDVAYAGLTATGWPTVYDTTDDWLLAGGPDRRRARLARSEHRVLRAADAVVVCSDALAESRRPARPDLVLIPNGVDAGHFARPQQRPVDLPDTPVVVYVGTLHEDRLDVDLVEELAHAMPDVGIALVGPNALGSRSDARLRACPNVMLLDARPYESVPAYLQHADVIVIPHVVSPFTESLDPIKAYECLAVGRPTVATAVAGFRDLPLPIRTVMRQDFVAAVRVALTDPNGSPPVEVPSWEDRARSFASVLERAEQSRAGHPPRVRVAYLGHTAVLSGGELALARLILALDHVEPLVVLGEDGPLVARLQSAGFRVEVMPLPERTAHLHRDRVRGTHLPVVSVIDSLRYAWRLRRWLSDEQVDVVHTNSLKADLYGGLAGRLAGVPVVWHVRDRIASDYLPSAAVALMRGLARVLPSAIIVNSRATAVTLARSGATVIPSPLETNSAPSARVTVVPDVAPTKEGRWPPAPRPFTVGLVGRLAPWKGQDLFLRAFAVAFPTGDARARIVGAALFGEDDWAARLPALAAELGIADRVDFVGFTDDVRSEYARIDVLVHASTVPEPFGQVVVEAMAAGVPVVAANAGGPAEVVTAGVDGILYPMGDVNALASALRSLADDLALRRSLAAAGQRRAEDFTAERIAPQVMQVYRRVLAQRHIRGRKARSRR
ncbi:MAG: glycosyltransferase [Actinomycetota bacterium]